MAQIAHQNIAYSRRKPWVYAGAPGTVIRTGRHSAFRKFEDDGSDPSTAIRRSIRLF